MPALENLRQANPWPDTHGVPAWDYTLGGGGRYLIDDIIKTRKPKLMLEIGCFLCASSKRWLSLDNKMTLIGVDPWDDSLIDQCARYVGRPALTRAYPDIETQQRFAADIAHHGPFKSALANMREFEERFVPIRDTSPDALYQLHAADIAPDLIYIDAGKNAEDLEISHKLWPGAIITGDDWHWGRTKGYPMRKIVNDFAEKHGFRVEADHATWILEKED